MKSPLTLEPLFHIGPAPITEPVVVAWAVMALIVRLRGAVDAAPRARAVQDAGGGRNPGLHDRRPDQRHDAGRSGAVSRPHRLDLPVHPDLELVVARSRRRAADRPYRDRRGDGPDRVRGDDRLGRALARARRLSRDFRRAELGDDPAQHRRAVHPHLLAHRAPVRQRDERRVRDRHRADACRPHRADPADGARPADRDRSGLHIRGAGDGVHRLRRRRAPQAVRRTRRPEERGKT